jgi:mersacidin/lichenicidin family type 2 lantibiotic
MTKLDVIRAWKDEDYRFSLSAADRAMLPADPAGVIELSDVDLGGAGGGGNDAPLTPVTVTMTVPICNTNMFTMSCITACPTIMVE